MFSVTIRETANFDHEVRVHYFDHREDAVLAADLAVRCGAESATARDDEGEVLYHREQGDGTLTGPADRYRFVA